MRRLFIHALAALMVVGASSVVKAQDSGKLYINDFTIDPGQTKTVEIVMDTPDYQVTAFQCDIYLPDGLTIPDFDSDYSFELTDRKHRTHDIHSNFKNGCYMIMCYSPTSKNINGNSGAIVTFEVLASADFKGGNIEMAAKTLVESDATRHDLDDSTTKVSTTAIDDPVIDNPVTDDANALVIEDITVGRHADFDIPVLMNNEAPISAFQCDIVIPNGLTVKEYDGYPDIVLSDRATRTHNILAEYISDNTIRVLCYSTKSSAFIGSAGEIFSIPFNAPAVPDNYEIRLTNIELSETNATPHTCGDAKCTVSISPYIPGDANGDGEITITDVVYITNYILTIPAPDFIEEAGDANGDGDITVSDVVFTVNIILEY